MQTISNRKKAERKAMRLEAEKKINFLEREFLHKICARSMFSEIYKWNTERLDYFISRNFVFPHEKYK